MNIRLLAKTIFGLSLVAVAEMAQGQAAGAYPARPVRVIVPVAPGGGADPLARLIAQKLGDQFNQSFIVENIAGAGGLIAMQTLARAVPDGHNLVLGSSSTYNNSILSGNKSVDVRKSLAPVAQLTSNAFVVSVPSQLPMRSFQELVAYGKKNPDGLNYTSVGVGSVVHLLGEMINADAGLKMVPVHYKGVGPAITDAIAGRIQVVLATTSATSPYARSGKIRPLAITSSTRRPSFPDVPTVAEQGLPGFGWVSWFGLLTTSGTPSPVILALNKGVATAVNSPEVQKAFAADGSESSLGTPEQFREVIDQVLERAEKVVKRLNITAD